VALRPHGRPPVPLWVAIVVAAVVAYPLSRGCEYLDQVDRDRARARDLEQKLEEQKSRTEVEYWSHQCDVKVREALDEEHR
jgi:hypothetical protein